MQYTHDSVHEIASVLLYYVVSTIQRKRDNENNILSY